MELRSALGTGLLYALTLLSQASALEGQGLPHALPPTGDVRSYEFAGPPSVWPVSLPGFGGLLQEAGSHWRTGAGIGLVVGGVGTYLVLRSGDSTAPCNQSANQDAWSSSACLGAAAVGGVVGAGMGALIGSRFRREEGTRNLQYFPTLVRGPKAGIQMQLQVRY